MTDSRNGARPREFLAALLSNLNECCRSTSRLTGQFGLRIVSIELPPCQFRPTKNLGSSTCSPPFLSCTLSRKRELPLVLLMHPGPVLFWHVRTSRRPTSPERG